MTEFKWVRRWWQRLQPARQDATARRRAPRFRPGVEMLEERRLLATYTVTSGGDDGIGATIGQLRWAIDQVNGGPGGDTIAFQIPFVGGPAAIIPIAPLPALSKPVTIDGWTQANGTPGVWIEIDGARAGASDGLTLNAGSSTLRGLAIDQFSGNGLVLNNPAGTGGLGSPGGAGGGGDTVYDCYIGTDVTGTAGKGNGGNGLVVTGPDNNIGDSFTGYWSVFSGNGGNGIEITGSAAQHNVVFTADVGVDVTGNRALPNGSSGIQIDSGAANNTIGFGAMPSGTSGGPAYNAVISANGGRGVYLSQSSGNVIESSSIGLGVDGSTPLGNGADGVALVSGSSNNTISDDVISDNAAAGVVFSGVDVTGNRITGSLIGTDGTGTVAEGNGGDGVTFASAPANTIGGSAISGNAGNGITITGDDNLVSASMIGTNEAGTTALGNGNDGVYVGSNSNTIGGVSSSGGYGAPTVISGNNNAGIDLAGQSNQVPYCYVGTDASGLAAMGNGGDGLDIEGDNNTVGTQFAMFAPLPWSVYSGNNGDGITKTGANKALIFHCYIGVDSTGLRDKPNKHNGVVLSGGSDNTVDGNVISGNTWDGVVVKNESGDVVLNNIVGLGSDGSTTLNTSNRMGIAVIGTAFATARPTDNTISGNTISGNSSDGVFIGNVTKTVVQGNYIGTDQGGTKKRANGGHGVDLGIDADHNTIGGGGTGQGNVISGNAMDGITMLDPSAGYNVVQGNYIGTDKNGTAAMGNGGNGITVNSTNNTIGGNWYEGEGNVIAGSGGYGITFGSDASANVVQGNYIGTDKNGKGQLVNGQNVFGNGNDGVYIAGSCNIIGGDVDINNSVFEGNIISGNKGDGIDIHGGATNWVLGNWIGLDGSGAAPLGNLLNGVEMTASASGNTIGGRSAAQGNVISGNGSQPNSRADNGVFIWDGASNNYLWNNYIGTDKNGTAAVGNWGDGVYIEVTAGGGNQVGGAPGLGNVISSNGAVANGVSGYGIDLTQSTIEDYNIIGWNKNGQVVPGNKLPNKLGGAPAGWIFGAHDNNTPL